jgi:hypothetical protein
MQAANDAGDLEDLRRFSTPEMFAAFRLDLHERAGRAQRTDVVQLHAEAVDIAEEAGQQIVSVRYHGLLREDDGWGRDAVRRGLAPHPAVRRQPRLGHRGDRAGRLTRTHHVRCREGALMTAALVEGLARRRGRVRTCRVAGRAGRRRRRAARARRHRPRGVPALGGEGAAGAAAVESDAADRLALTDDELALACASHAGEPAHVRTAAGMLAKAGVDAAVLECGVHWPYSERAQRELAAHGELPGALHNNCSGKHAGFVCLACALMGWNDGGLDLRRYVKGYVQAQHPVMQEVRDALESTTGCTLAQAPQGVDGCSIPTYAIPLRRLAHAFARFGSGVGLRAGQQQAAQRLRAAVAASPGMVGGSERFDTRVMQRFGTRVFCKVGAEGVYCAALPGRGLGLR